MLRRAIAARNSLCRVSISQSSLTNRLTTRFTATQSSNSGKSATEAKDESKNNLKSKAGEEPKEKRKTQAELDEELRQKLEGIAGDGGAAGLELEDGVPVSMKRGVKNNMFRYI